MPSAARPRPGRGLARERTALAWQRMALGFTSLAAVMLGAAAHRDAPWMLGPAALMFVVAAAVWLHARRRGRDLSLRTTSRPLRLLTLATAVAAVVAAVMAIVAPG
jgi:uncharacterized membrane protein YidH (DUF202 family)